MVLAGRVVAADGFLGEEGHQDPHVVPAFGRGLFEDRGAGPAGIAETETVEEQCELEGYWWRLDRPQRRRQRAPLVVSGGRDPASQPTARLDRIGGVAH